MAAIVRAQEGYRSGQYADTREKGGGAPSANGINNAERRRQSPLLTAAPLCWKGSASQESELIVLLYLLLLLLLRPFLPGLEREREKNWRIELAGRTDSGEGADFNYRNDNGDRSVRFDDD